MKKVFVSLPMNGKTDEEILKEREECFERAKHILGEDTELIDTFITEDPPEGCNVGLWYLAKSLELMANADIVYLAHGWDEARGCVLEHEAAIHYGIKCIQHRIIYTLIIEPIGYYIFQED